MNWQDEQKKVATGVSRTQQQEIETLKRCLFEMQEAAKNLVQQTKREWIGLTAEEREQVQSESYGKVPHHVALIAAVEAKLKEKNT